MKLEVAENKFRRITEKTSDIICQHIIDGVLYYVSKSSREILGYEPSEMINKIGLDFIHIDDFSVLKNACREFIKTAKNIPVTYRFRKKNNSYVWLETTSRNIINQDNVIIGIQTSSRDVIERIKREQELKMALANENEFNDNKFKFCP
ncbi:PAS domain-containing protein [Flavobacterium sp. W20_MBD1_R3]|uniref:PAS domain-containing protein n=1 Tax=Flavobacterium sp. W20_MBD1_R3 TaxID=3240278 RepID=UPI003F93CB99